MLNKICTSCNTTFYALKVEDFAKKFHKAKVGKYGFNARCKSCRFELEVKPNREKRAEYDRLRRGNIIEPKPCIVCGTVFTPKREQDKCCGKECTKFKKKVYYKHYIKNVYLDVLRDKRQKEIERCKENSRKRYTEEELLYIKKNSNKPKLIAKKLGRTLNAVNKKIKLLQKVTQNKNI